jgi:hypothetical protein
MLKLVGTAMQKLEGLGWKTVWYWAKDPGLALSLFFFCFHSKPSMPGSFRDHGLAWTSAAQEKKKQVPRSRFAATHW